MQKQDIGVPAFSEVSFLSLDHKSITVVLTEGTCDSFGTTLKPLETYVFKNKTNVSLYTTTGCKLSVAHSIKTKISIGNSERMDLIYELYNRIHAEREKGGIPVTLVCGPCDSGKSTISKIIISKSVAAGLTPIFVDLDCGQNSISLPSTISAVVIDSPPSVTEGLVISNRVVSYELGTISSPRRAIPLTIQLFRKLSRIVYSLISNDEKLVRSGVVINTSGYVQRDGLLMLKGALECFSPSSVCVVGDPSLGDYLKSCYIQNPNCFWYFIPGPSLERVGPKAKPERKNNRLNSVKAYFATCEEAVLPLDSVAFVKIDYDTMKYVTYKLTPVTGAVFAFVYSDRFSNDIVSDSFGNIAGYLMVKNIDFERGNVTALLLNANAPLPSRILVYTGIIMK